MWKEVVMKLDLKAIAEQEAYLQFELYRVIKNYILTTQQTPLSRSVFDLLGFKWERAFNVFSEVLIKGERIDLLVTVDGEPFFVIETKKRVKNESYSIARKVVKTKTYAENVGARFYSVCNGWLTFIFSFYDYPYLLGVCGVDLTEDYAKKLLLGLIKFQNKNTLDVLSKLPRVPDRFDVEKKIIPSILQQYAMIDRRVTPETYLSTWLNNIY